MMLESDGGVFRPLGFGFTGNDAGRQTVRTIASLLTGIAADQISGGGGGADIGPSVTEGRVPAMSLDVDGSKLLPHPPHAGRHHRQDRSGRDGEVRRRGVR